MLCKCTIHIYGFELVGPRVTDQAIVSICCAAGNIANHMYFRMHMDSNLLPKVKILTNSFQKKVLWSGYSCGHIYTCISVKVLGPKDTIDL